MKSVFAVVALAGSASAAAVSTAKTVTIGTEPRQTLTSFGASGAWWPNDLIHFPQSTQKQLANLLFSPSGLYLSSYRYNMGGDGGNDTQQVTTNDSRVESFLLRNGTYDWSRDHAGVTFLQYAQAYAVPYITFFINAAPSHIATNGAACGWNMTASRVTAFASYITTVLSHWTTQGIDITYISPMNEPDNNRADCGQEGMAVAPSLRPSVFQTLRSSLNTSPSASHVAIIGDETSQITTQADPEDPIWLPSSAPDLAHIAVHNYDYPSDAALATYYQNVLALTNTSHLPPIKFTETCCSTTSGSGSSVFGEQYDPTMTNALIVARYIWQFLTITQAVSFDWWTAVANLPCSPTIDGQQCATAVNNTAGYNSGLISIDPNYNVTRDFTLYVTKRAWMLKHFAYFHRPGSVRFDVGGEGLPDGVEAFASSSSSSSGWESSGAGAGGHGDGRTWSLLFINNQTSAFDVQVQVPAKGVQVKRIVQTTQEVDFGDVLPLPKVNGGGNIEVNLPGESLLTVVFA